MLSGWLEFSAAFALFLGSHMIPSRPALRERLCAVFGQRLYLILYSLLSLALLGWLIVAAGRAPFVAVWDFAPWQLWVPNVAMPLACLLIAFGVGAENPLSFGGRNKGSFDPDHPGIAGVCRHPLLLAITLWAAAHMAPNGDLAHLLLFGPFALMGVGGMVLIDRRKRRMLGPATWDRLAANTPLLPFGTLASGRWRPDPRRFPWLRLAADVLLYLALVELHPAVIGVSPLPLL